MNSLDNFPCYDVTELDQFDIQSIKPVSVTIPYDKTFAGKMIKKSVDKEQGDLIAYSFTLTEKPNLNDNDITIVTLMDEKITVKVLTSFQQVFKGHRVYSYVCQIKI